MAPAMPSQRGYELLGGGPRAAAAAPAAAPARGSGRNGDEEGRGGAWVKSSNLPVVALAVLVLVFASLIFAPPRPRAAALEAQRQSEAAQVQAQARQPPLGGGGGGGGGGGAAAAAGSFLRLDDASAERQPSSSSLAELLCPGCTEPWEATWVDYVCGAGAPQEGAPTRGSADASSASVWAWPADDSDDDDDAAAGDAGGGGGGGGAGRGASEETDEGEGSSANETKETTATTTTLTTTTPLPPQQFPILGEGALLAYWGSANFARAASVPSAARNLVLLVHGGQRNARDYFCYLKHVVEASRLAPNETFMVVPKFEQHSDGPRPGELWWNGSKPWGDWRGGASSDNRSGGVVSSYAVFDEILRFASNRSRFPLLEKAVVIGHSAGGQTVHRYSLVSWLPPSGLSSAKEALDGRSLFPGLHVRYVVGNPSTYLYLDENRWQYTCGKKTSGNGTSGNETSGNETSGNETSGNGTSGNGTSGNETSFEEASGDAADQQQRRRRRRRRTSGNETSGNETSFEEASGDCSEMVYERYEPDLGRAGWREDRRRYAWNRRRTGFDGLAPMNETNRFACQGESFNSWHYGINWTEVQAGNAVPYVRDHPDLMGALDLYPSRDVIYLVGQNDTCTDGYLGFCFPSCWQYDNKCDGSSIDMRCPAMLEGPNRNYRAKNYMKHLESHFGRKVHSLHEEPGVGHQAEKLMISALNELHYLQLKNGRRVVE